MPKVRLDRNYKKTETIFLCKRRKNWGSSWRYISHLSLKILYARNKSRTLRGIRNVIRYSAFVNRSCTSPFVWMSAFVEKVGLCGFFLSLCHIYFLQFLTSRSNLSLFFFVCGSPRINGVDDRKFLDYQLLAIITARFYQQRGFLLSFRYHCNIGFFFTYFFCLHKMWLRGRRLLTSIVCKWALMSFIFFSFFILLAFFFLKRTARNGGTYVIYDDRMPEVDGGIGRFQIRGSFYNVSAL